MDCAARLRAWLDASLANRMAWAAGTLALGFSSFLTLIAFVSIGVLLVHQMDIAVRAQSAADAGLGAGALTGAVERVREMARHSMVVNGLIDSSGRQSYLVPFIEQDPFRSRLDGTLVVCDPAGDIIASAGRPLRLEHCAAIPSDASRQTPGLAQVSVTQESGEIFLSVRDPIYMKATGSVEGLVIGRVSVRRILEEAGVWNEPTLVGFELDGLRQVKGEGESEARAFRVDAVAPLVARVVGRALALRLFHVVPLAPLYTPVKVILLIFVVTLVILVLMVAYLARLQAARLSVPLMLLKEATARASAGNPVKLDPVLIRGDEIGTLATAVKSMTDTLQGQGAALREAQRIAGIGSWEQKLGSDSITWSEGLHLILGRDLSLGPPTFPTLSRFYTPASWERLRAAIATAIEAGVPYELELEMIRADGTICWTTTRGEPVRGPNGAVVSLRGTVHDITERKQADEKIRAALAEKEVLLKEIYHRVKNNLQVVSSLLNLQSRRVTDATARQLLGDSAGRVKSMALVHEQLYRTENLSSIGLPEYLRQLADNLVNVNRPLSTRVLLKVEVDELLVGVESAIPLGLVVNELVTNAYRHGYAADAPAGEIVLRLTRLPEGRFCLEVQDDGLGLPADFEPGKGGALGMQLVLTLSRQLGAELTWNANREGTCFTLHFRPEAHAAQPEVA
jgi:two-component sensor histidine kinase/PAS domain-containing protein